MYRKWICLAMLFALLRAVMTGCKAPAISQGTEEPSSETQETLENIPGVGANDFTDEDFHDSLSGTTNDGTEATDSTESTAVTQPSTGSTEPTKPTEPAKPTESTESTESTEPIKPTKPVDPTEPEEDTKPSEENKITAYEWYENLSPEEQVAYFQTFESMEAFVKWHNEAKAEYDRLHPPIDAGDGNIDFGDIAGN